MAVPARREVLHWFHGLEDDPVRAGALYGGSALMEAASRDGLMQAGDADGFADLFIRMREEDLVAFTAFHGGLQQFGTHPSYDLQQATDFHSTPEGRAWVREASSGGHSFDLRHARIGQLAAGDIENITVMQFFDAVGEEIERIGAPEDQRREARHLLDRMKQGAAGVATEGSGGLLAVAIARALGLG